VLSLIITLNGNTLIWKNEIRYLGLYILSGRTFKINLQPSKQKFFRAVNAIFGKIISLKNPSVILSLFQSFCVPILFYSLEALWLNKSQRNSIDFVYNNIFVKIFNVQDSQSISLCQLYMGYLPASYLLDLKTLNFHYSLVKNVNSLSFVISKVSASTEVNTTSQRHCPNSWQTFQKMPHSIRKKILFNTLYDKFDI